MVQTLRARVTEPLFVGEEAKMASMSIDGLGIGPEGVSSAEYGRLTAAQQQENGNRAMRAAETSGDFARRMVGTRFVLHGPKEQKEGAREERKPPKDTNERTKRDKVLDEPPTVRYASSSVSAGSA